MKNLIALLVLTVVASAAQANDSGVISGGMVPATVTIELDESTQALILDMKTVNGVSCPGQLELKQSPIKNGEMVISYDNTENEALFAMMGRVSNVCSEEILEAMNKSNQYVCLSYGIEKGTVMVDLRNLPTEMTKLTVRMPSSIEAEAITQL